MTSPNVLWAARSIAQFQTIWDPHWGCAILAGNALLEKHLVGEKARSYVQEVIDSIKLNHRPEQQPSAHPDVACKRDDFLRILAQESPSVREIGHEWIYGAYILSMPVLGPECEQGSFWASMCRLLDMIQASGPGWITVNGKNTVLPVPIHPAKKKTSSGRLEEILGVFANFSRSANMEKRDMQLGHLLTHGHAIHVMDQLGFDDLADAATRAWQARLDALNYANALENHLVPFELMDLDPEDAAFWKLAVAKWTGGHGHLLKYVFSFLELRRASQSHTVGLTKAFGRILISLEKD